MTDDIDAPLPARITAWQVQKDGDRSGFWKCGLVAAHNKTDYIRADLYEALQAENARLRKPA